MPDLRSAVVDAEVLAEVLQRKYRFKVTTLLDADRHQILTALNELYENL